jgi:hypothetical protein
VWVLPQAIEAVYQFALRDYVNFMRDVGKVKPPYTVEAGLAGVKNGDLYMTDQRGGEIFGPMYDDVKLRETLLNDSEAEQEKFLLRLFEKIFDQSGRERPAYYNGFPRDPMRLIADSLNVTVSRPWMRGRSGAVPVRTSRKRNCGSTALRAVFCLNAP